MKLYRCHCLSSILTQVHLAAACNAQGMDADIAQDDCVKLKQRHLQTCTACFPHVDVALKGVAISISKLCHQNCRHDFAACVMGKISQKSCLD
jgi:hypothetical protein